MSSPSTRESNPAKATQAGGLARVLTFRVGAARLAAPAGAVTEVLRPPPITRVPHAPASLLGIATVRGAVVPVVSLARLLEGDGATPPEVGRVLLFDAGEPVALAVDEVGALAELDIGDTGPDGALYTDGDGATRLIDLKDLLRRAFAGLAARTRAGDGRVRAIGHQPRAAADERAFLAFTLAGQSYALPLAEVAEAIAVPNHLVNLPGNDAAMVGAVSHRGRLLPIVSARVLLGLEGDAAPRADEGRAARVVVAYGPGSPLGLLVDRLTTILRVPADSVAAVPALLNRGRGRRRSSPSAACPMVAAWFPSCRPRGCFGMRHWPICCCRGLPRTTRERDPTWLQPMRARRPSASSSSTWGARNMACPSTRWRRWCVCPTPWPAFPRRPPSSRGP
ncbi:chemotaxis protein CheW [Nitrospirillum sp. BR 11828]|uniref:chemotaxis protein CheW n=1 Tax=Nitrospirillum sp. BR 11828 TaxID=3104325 RepID=UPI002ACAD180|nr:chemotaxis protein CheW [Nitrospirillum sp. BR 11828]MDZ5648412.1 chemotaxis protein CheW [Nitrospirillum sp. BR 11828]